MKKQLSSTSTHENMKVFLLAAGFLAFVMLLTYLQWYA
jgi:hypothetical protein